MKRHLFYEELEKLVEQLEALGNTKRDIAYMRGLLYKIKLEQESSIADRAFQVQPSGIMVYVPVDQVPEVTPEGTQGEVQEETPEEGVKKKKSPWR